MQNAENRDASGRGRGHPGAGPKLEFEGLLKVAFADHGKEQLVAQLGAIRAEARARMGAARAQAADYATSGGPFPERLPVIGLVGRYLLESAELLERWADWAQREGTCWDGTTRREGAVVPEGAFRAERAGG